MPEAAPSDVKDHIDTELSDADINDILDFIERDWKREYSSNDFQDTNHIKDFEAVAAAVQIVENKGRRAESEQRESVSITFESSELENLRGRLRRLDPGDNFGFPSGVVTDGVRYSGSAERTL